MWAYLRVLTTLVLIFQTSIATSRDIISIGETRPNVIRIGDSGNNTSRIEQPRSSNNKSNRSTTRSREFVAPYSGSTSPLPSLSSRSHESNPPDSGDTSNQQRWVERQRQLFTETVTKFIAPSIGSTITIVPRIGRTKVGIINALTANSVTVDDTTYLRSQLDTESCSFLFAQDWAGQIVKAQVLKEQREYPSIVKKQTQSVADSLQRAASQPFESAEPLLAAAIAENPEAQNRTEAVEELGRRRAQQIENMAQAEKELARRRAQHIEEMAQAEKLKQEQAQRDAEAEQDTAEDEITMNTMGNDLAAAVAAGKVSVEFSGMGGSSGDSIKVTVTKLEKNSESLILSIAPGTRLESGNPREQDMVVAGVKGELIDERRYRLSSDIKCDAIPRTFVLDAYCAEFSKANPSSNTKLSMGPVDHSLARILDKASNLSLQAKQAAVWIYTDKADYQHVNKKFPLSESDWAAAQEACKAAQAPKQGKLKRDTVALPLPIVVDSTKVGQEKSIQVRSASETRASADHCPVCGAGVSLGHANEQTGVVNCVCENGHEWHYSLPKR